MKCSIMKFELPKFILLYMYSISAIQTFNWLQIMKEKKGTTLLFE